MCERTGTCDTWSAALHEQRTRSPKRTTLACAWLQGEQFLQCQPRVSVERGSTRRVEHVSGVHHTLIGQRHRRPRSVSQSAVCERPSCLICLHGQMRDTTMRARAASASTEARKIRARRFV